MAGHNFVSSTRPRLDDRVKSAWHAFVNVNIPVAVSGEPPPVTLALNAEGWKTPDITENPNAIYLGCSTDGLTITPEITKEDQFCDEQVDPESTVITARKIKIAGNYLGVLDEKLLTALYGLTVWHAPSDTFEHYGDNINGGAVQANLIVVFQREVAGVEKYGYILFPNTEQSASFPSGKFSRKSRLEAPVEFTAKGYPGYGGKAFTKYFEK